MPVSGERNIQNDFLGEIAMDRGLTQNAVPAETATGRTSAQSAFCEAHRMDAPNSLMPMCVIFVVHHIDTA